MKVILILIALMGSSAQLYAESSQHHEMQHGFILFADDTFASHLVASGHHSHQAEITGHLAVDDLTEKQIYEYRKAMNKKSNSSYFLFQAQSLDLPSLKDGQILSGHIIESKVGQYESKNIIVKKATFKIKAVLLNIENPFFGNQ